MPMWSPPTPPQDDNDVYIDQTLCFLYEPTTMPESHLPPVYVKKEAKRIRVDGTVGRKHKIRKDDQPRVPRSLFDRPSKFLKLKQQQQGLFHRTIGRPAQTFGGRPMIDQSHDHPEWLIHEDWALLQAVQMLLELPLTLTTSSPAHIPNWDMVADVVNAGSRTYRSPKQCKNRYENVIVPREEGKILYDTSSSRKQKKSKAIYKTKNNRPMRTSQLFVQDSNTAVTTLFSLRFDSCKAIAQKRTPTLRPTLANPTLKNPKHAAVLGENGISYDTPMTPTQVATIRAERIAKEKKQNQVEQQQLAAQRAQQQVVTTTLTPSATVAAIATAGTVTVATTQAVAVPVTTTVAAAPQMTIVQGQQITPVTLAAVSNAATVVAGTLQKAAAVGNTVTAVSLARSLGATGSIVVNTAGGVAGNTFATINKRMSQSAAGGVTVTTASVTAGALTQAVRARTTTAMTVQDITAAVASQAAAQTRIATQGITTTALTPAQLIAAQRGGPVTAASVAAGTVQQQLAGQTTTRLTQQQIQYLKTQQTLIRQQRQLQQAKINAVAQAQQQQAGTRPKLSQSDAVKAQQIQQLKAQAQRQAVALGQVQATTSQAGASPVQKTVAVNAQLITSVAQTQASHTGPQPARLQVVQATKQQTVKPGTVPAVQVDAQVAALFKQQQQLRQQKLQAVATSGQQGAPQVHQLTTAQLIAGTQVQHVQQSGSNTPSVATLVKTVTSQGGAAGPSVTIPVSAVSLGNVNLSVSLPQQKAGVGKAQQQQLRHIQLQQIQQRKAPQLQTQQKVATLTGAQMQVTKGQLAPLNTVQIIQQQQNLPKAVTMQLQQIMRQQAAAAQQTPIQHMITSVPPTQPTSGTTVITTQIVTQAQPTVQTVTRMSVPSASTSVARTSTPVTVTAVPVSNPMANVVSQHSVSMASPTVTLTTSQPTLVKQIQEVVQVSSSPTKVPIQTSVAQQLKAAAAVRQVQGVTVGQTQAGATAIQVQTQPMKQQPTLAVQQAVQQVQAQAQQQAAQRQQALAAAVVAAGNVTSAAASAAQPGQANIGQTIVQGQQTTADSQKASPYTMRLRNPPKH